MNDEEQDRLEALGEQLRAKISSKFQTSTFLAGFALAVLGVQISAIVQWQGQTIPVLLFVSISLLLAAVVLFIGAIVRLDELTMPKLFWKVDPNHSEPKQAHLGYLVSDDLTALKERMVFYWTHLTLYATYVTAFALALMLLPLSWFEVPARSVNARERWFVFAMMCCFSIVALLYIVWLDCRVASRHGTLRRPVD